MTGAVTWPTWARADPTGVTLVYAVVLADPAGDPYLPTLTAETMLLINPHPDIDRRLQPIATVPALRAWANAVAKHTPILTAVLLGTTGHIYRSTTTPPDRSVPWHCDENSLGVHGRAALSVLRLLYGRDPLLITFIDPTPGGGASE